MEREDAEDPLLRHDRRRQHGADTVLGEAAHVTEAAVVGRGRLEHVRHRDGAPEPGGEVDDREPRRVAERRHARRVPLGGETHRVVLVAEPDEAADSVDRDADLLEDGREHLTDVPARPELERDVRDQPLALERVGERDRRTGTLQRQPCFAHERLHPAQLVLVEHARAPDRAEDDRDHLVAGPNGHEDAALGPGDRVQTLVDDGGVLGVVDRERGPLADGGVDPGRLAVERDPLADQGGVVPAALAGGDEHGGEPVVLDQGQVREVELERVGELVEQHLRDVGRLGGVEQLLREARAHGLALARGASLATARAVSPREGRNRRSDHGQRHSAATAGNGTASNSTA